MAKKTKVKKKAKGKARKQAVPGLHDPQPPVGAVEVEPDEPELLEMEIGDSLQIEFKGRRAGTKGDRSWDVVEFLHKGILRFMFLRVELSRRFDAVDPPPVVGDVYWIGRGDNDGQKHTYRLAVISRADDAIPF